MSAFSSVIGLACFVSLAISFIDMICPEKKFENTDILKAQILQNIEETKEYFANMHRTVSMYHLLKFFSLVEESSYEYILESELDFDLNKILIVNFHFDIPLSPVIVISAPRRLLLHIGYT